MMKTALHILLLFALLPMAAGAREESLEERKQRIMRKYMRDRANLVQSDLVVPETESEDERVKDSKDYAKLEIEYEKEEGVAKPPAVPPRPVVKPQERNWLLEDMDAEADPYADPFSLGMEDETGGSYLSGWDSYGSGDAYSQSDRKQRRYTPAEESSYTRDSAYTASDRSSSRTSIFGRRQDESAYSSQLGPAQPRTFGVSPDTGLLNSPYVRRDQGAESDEVKSPFNTRQPDSTTYQSPFERQRQQQQQQRQQSQDEYKRVDPYQQWKDRNKTWDPTRDDAYLNELMNKDFP
jgi:hypothetical protein